MADIYNRQASTLGGVFTSDRMIVSMGTEVPTALLQSTNFNYQQTVSKFYELSSNHIFLIGGRTQGSAAIGHIIGPKRAMSAFFAKYGDVCKARSNTIDMSLVAQDCDIENFAEATTTLTAKLCVIVNVSIGVEAQQAIINSNSQLMFSSLEYKENGQTVFT
jgi:hypothetical protein